MICYNLLNKREWESDAQTSPPVALTPKEGKMRIKSIPQLTSEQIESFWSQVQKTASCWLWSGRVNTTGYGIFSISGESFYAHRVAYTLTVGEIPEGLPLDHVKARGCNHHNCVNSEHLEPITHRENVLRSDGIAAKNARKTHCVRGHELSPDNLYFNCYGRRRCRKCVHILTRLGPFQRSCKICGTEFLGRDSRAKYCSRECRAENHNAKRRRTGSVVAA